MSSVSETKKRGHGGPSTPEGKSVSCQNALKHGLTSKKLLPQILGKGLVRQAYERLRVEWRPITPTQAFCVKELARHEAALSRCEEMELAVLQRGAKGVPGVSNDFIDEEDLWGEALAGAGTSDALERISRYRRSHERAYAHSLQILRDIQAMSNTPQETTTPQKQSRFQSETECKRYLINRLKARTCCPHCGAGKGTWISSRNVWQCSGCRRQIGLRFGSVMERSRLDLLVWFHAIEAVRDDPHISISDLSEAIGVGRTATLRRILSEIKKATHAPNASELLVGLDKYLGAPAQS